MSRSNLRKMLWQEQPPQKTGSLMRRDPPQNIPNVHQNPPKKTGVTQGERPQNTPSVPQNPSPKEQGSLVRRDPQNSLNVPQNPPSNGHPGRKTPKSSPHSPTSLTAPQSPLKKRGEESVGRVSHEERDPKIPTKIGITHDRDPKIPPLNSNPPERPRCPPDPPGSCGSGSRGC